MIDRFDGKHRWLSNFYECPVEIDGIVYPSAEHAFVAAKTDDAELKAKIATIETPGWAKKFGRKLPLRDNWDSIRVEEMYKIVLAKFTQNDWLASKLVATWPVELIEGNYWNDRFWGQDLAGYGSNHLGKILMRVREQLLGKSNEEV